VYGTRFLRPLAVSQFFVGSPSAISKENIEIVLQTGFI